MRWRVWQGWIVALAVAALVAGCGGDGGGSKDKPAATQPKPAPAVAGAPKPVESAAQAARRIDAFASKGDCASLDDVFPANSGVTPKLCQQLLPTMRSYAGGKVQSYGTAAVVSNDRGGQMILGLDRSGHFRFETFFDGPLPKLPLSLASDTAENTVTAVRNDNCDELLPLALTYQQASGKKFCALKPVRRLHTALDRDFDAQAKPLGGNGSFAFYGIATKPHGYFTLVLTADPRHKVFLFVTSIEA
jgi:hypothetical protein